VRVRGVRVCGVRVRGVRVRRERVRGVRARGETGGHPGEDHEHPNHLQGRQSLARHEHPQQGAADGVEQADQPHGPGG